MESERRQRLECMCHRPGTAREDPRGAASSLPPRSAGTQLGDFSAALGLQLLTAGGPCCWLVWCVDLRVGPAGVALAGVALSRLGPDQNVVPTRRSQRPAPSILPPPAPAPQWDRCKGERGLVTSSWALLLLRRTYWPLTDLGKCSSDEGAQGTPHSCAALAPVLAQMDRST